MALTATTRVVDGVPRVRLNEAYVHAVRAAGLIPLVVPPLDADAAEGILAAVHGLVLTGGEDVEPSMYGMARGDRTGPAQETRDRCEIALVRGARQRRLPTLAICRGMQVVNVAFGGTLVQDIPSECRGTLEHDRADDRDARVHEVHVEPDSQLARALGASHLGVNSSHHQALARVAPGLRVTARAPDGVIEGAEWTSDAWWMLAVQWHPEELVRDSAGWDRGIFRSFADAVRGG